MTTQHARDAAAVGAGAAAASPEPASQSSACVDFARQFGNRRVSQQMLQRYHKVEDPAFVTKDSLGKSHPTTVTLFVAGRVDEDSGATGEGVPQRLEFSTQNESVKLSDGVMSGSVKFESSVKWRTKNILADDEGDGSWVGRVPFTVNGEQLTFGAPVVDNQRSSGAGAVFTATPAASGSNCVLTVAVATSNVSDTLGGSGGLGPISASAPYSASRSSPGNFSRGFTVTLTPTPPRPINGPPARFKINDSKLEDGQEGAIAAWYKALPERTQAAIRNGKRCLVLAGYASTTGRRRKNRDLSEARVNVVKRILSGMAGSSATITTHFLGKDGGHGPDETEDPTQRTTTMRVDVPTATTPSPPGE